MAAPKTRTPAPAPAPDRASPSTIHRALLLAQSALLIALLAASANASQLALSPVYGSIPPAQWHAPALAAGCFAGWAGHRKLSGSAAAAAAARALPVVALSVPAAQCFLFRLSQGLGPRWGPLATEGATLVPLAALTAACIADHAERIWTRTATTTWTSGAAAVLGWAALQQARRLAGGFVAARIGQAFRYTRVGMQLCLGLAYAALRPSGYVLLALPALLHTALVNPHVQTPAGTAALNGSMRAEGWLLLERRESVTGYVSVAHNVADMARVLRVDHSLLGGDWVDFRGARVTEPVYSVFVMLEAVRLVDRAAALADADAAALVIGLGIGTLPSALVAHGIATTVVEIDPAVYAFARKYFQLQENAPAVIDDAVAYTARLAAERARQFDYIVHDVFTGGAEPVDLFTLDFFRSLDALLRDDGVLAINYAGDLALPTPRIVLRTITAVFKNCRVFRENPRDEELFARSGADFTNLVVFCHKSPGKGFTFREPRREDLLDSRARLAYLKPRYEVPLAEFLGNDNGEGEGVLRSGDTGRVMEWHRRSAEGHWWIMRSVLKPSFWELW